MEASCGDAERWRSGGGARLSDVRCVFGLTFRAGLTPRCSTFLTFPGRRRLFRDRQVVENDRKTPAVISSGGTLNKKIYPQTAAEGPYYISKLEHVYDQAYMRNG